MSMRQARSAAGGPLDTRLSALVTGAMAACALLWLVHPVSPASSIAPTAKIRAADTTERLVPIGTVRDPSARLISKDAQDPQLVARRIGSERLVR